MSNPALNPSQTAPPPGESLPRAWIHLATLAGLTLVGVVVCGIMAWPFLPALAWAMALAIIAHPLHRWIEGRVSSPSWAAIASTTIVVPVATPRIKIENTQALGAEVILFDGDTAARWKKVCEIAEENHYTAVHGFEDPLVMAGQGTLGCEILEDLEGVDTVIVPLGGGGLISGVATAIKETNPSVRVIGAEPALTPKYYQSRVNQKRTSLPLKNTIADGVRISVPGQNPFPIIEKYVDEIVLVEDEHIVAGMRALAKDAKLIAEPAASIGLGALLAGSVKLRPDEKVCLVLSGGNWDLTDLADVYK